MTLEEAVSQKVIFQYMHWSILSILHKEVAYVSSKIWVQKQENKQTKMIQENKKIKLK